MDYELIIKALETMGTDAKWTLIIYFIADAVKALGMFAIISFTVLKVVRMNHATD